MKLQTRINHLLNIELPIIQGGMVWVSGWKLASAVSNCGGLGLIGSGSMKPELFIEHITKCKNATRKPFGVNIPLLRGDADKLIDAALNENINIFFTSAGHPGKFIDKLKSKKATVVHVVSNVKQALKAESVGCDAVVGEGVEAGGHNGPDELTTFALIPQIVNAVEIPVIAAGGIATGQGILAALSLGAEGVQIGTRFAVTQESSAHRNYKDAVCKSNDNSTTLILKQIGMARIIKNKFSEAAIKLEASNPGKEELLNLLGTKRERLGIFEGDEENGMMEAGQGVGLINDIPTVEQLIENLLNEMETAYKNLNRIFSVNN